MVALTIVTATRMGGDKGGKILNLFVCSTFLTFAGPQIMVQTETWTEI